MILEGISVFVLLLLLWITATMRVTWFRVSLFSAAVAIYYIVIYIEKPIIIGGV